MDGVWATGQTPTTTVQCSAHCTVQVVYNNNRPSKTPGPRYSQYIVFTWLSVKFRYSQSRLYFTSFLLMNFSFMLSTASWSMGQNTGAEDFLFCLKGMSRSPSTRETDRRRAERRDFRDL